MNVYEEKETLKSMQDVFIEKSCPTHANKHSFI